MGKLCMEFVRWVKLLAPFMILIPIPILVKIRQTHAHT